MYLEIITPDKKAFQGEVVAVNLPGSEGPFEVLNNHAAIISSLTAGTIRVRITSPKDETSFRIDGGTVEVLNNHIIVLAESVA